MKKKLTFILLPILLLLIGAGAGSWYWLKKKGQKLTFEEHLAKAEEFIAENNTRMAYGHTKNATMLNPNDADSHWQAVELAIPLRRRQEAYKHARSAWKNGMKEPVVLRMIFSLDDRPRDVKINSALKLSLEIEDEYERAILLADLLLDNQEFEKSLEQWKVAFRLKRDPVLVSRMARTFLAMNEADQARKFLRLQKKEKLLDLDGFMMLMDLFVLNGETDKAVSLAVEARQRGFQGPKLDLKEAKLRLLDGRLDRALKLLEPLVSSYDISPSDFLNFSHFLDDLSQKKSEGGRILYEKLNQESKDLLERWAAEQRVSVVLQSKIIQNINKLLSQGQSLDLPSNSEREVKRIGPKDLPNRQLETWRNNRTQLSLAFPEAFNDPRPSSIAHEARLLLTFLYSLQGKKKEIKELQKLFHAENTPWLEGELLFNNALSSVNGQSEAVIGLLSRARRLLRNHWVVEVASADGHHSKGDFNDVVRICSELKERDTLAARSILVIPLYASSLHKIGRSKEAMTMLLTMHKQGAMNRRSLELYRDITLAMGKKEFSWSAQRLIEERFPDKANVIMGRGKLAAASGNLDQAEQVIRKLESKFPHRKDYLQTRLNIMLKRGQAEQVLKELDQAELPTAVENLLRARATRHLGKNKDALSFYQKTIDEVSPSDVLNEYGWYLLTNQKPIKAYEIFERISHESSAWQKSRYGMVQALYQQNKLSDAKKMIADHFHLDGRDPLINLMMSQIVLDEGEPAKALGYCRTALSVDPNNAKARAIEGQCLLKLGQIDHAIESLQLSDSLQPNQTQVKMDLVKAFVASGNLDQAMSIIPKTTEVHSESIPWLAMRFDLYLKMKKGEEAQKTYVLMESFLNPETRVMAQSQALEVSEKYGEAVDLLSKHLKGKTIFMNWFRLNLMIDRDEDLKKHLTRNDLSAQDLAEMGSLALIKKKYSLAIKAFERALELSPERALFYNNLAWAYLQSGNFEQKALMKTIEKAVELDPGHVSIKDTFIESLYETKQYHKASEFIIENMAISNNRPRWLFRLAQCSEKQFDLVAATQYYERCLTFPEEKMKPWPLPWKRSEIEAHVKKLKEL